MRISYRVITPASVAPLRSNLLSPLDTTHYSTFDGVCQEGISISLKFFRISDRDANLISNKSSRTVPLLTLCSIAQVGMDYNR